MSRFIEVHQQDCHKVKHQISTRCPICEETVWDETFHEVYINVDQIVSFEEAYILTTNGEYSRLKESKEDILRLIEKG